VKTQITSVSKGCTKALSSSVAELGQNSSWGSQERQDRRLAGLPAARRRHASVVGGGAGAWWRSVAAMGGGVAWRAPAIMDGGAAGWSAETECCSGGQHLPSACRHRSDQSTPPIPPPSEQPPAGAASSRPIGRGASGRSGCSSTRPRSNGGGERRGVRLRMCGGRRRRCERVIRGVDDRLTGGRVVTKFFHLPALLSSRRVGRRWTPLLHCLPARLHAGREEDKGPGNASRR